jgi:DNA-binding GntR family transcriptional regulator
LTFYASNPDAGPTEAGRTIGVSRQTVYTYLAELEADGRIVRNDGKGIEVLERR